MEAGDLLELDGKTLLVLWGADEPTMALYPSPFTGANPFLFVEVPAA